ncbi:MAG: hypothetical protein ACTSPO_15190 [Candidatus Heimdallarchaeaceae archaeon]
MSEENEQYKELWEMNSRNTWEEIAAFFGVSQKMLKACLGSWVVIESIEDQLAFMKEEGFNPKGE